MNYNTFLDVFGLDANDFKKIVSDPIVEDNNILSFFLEQRTDINRECPFCFNTILKIILIHIKKVRFFCCACNHSFTPKLNNLSYGCSISDNIKNLITLEFFNRISFSDIARRYNVSVTTVFNIFDNRFPFVPRNSLPSILCIDEFHFSKSYDQNYCCAIVDLKSKKIVDILKNRKKAYLNEYFDSINYDERSKVRYFISDLYDEYRLIRKKFFPHAIHIADRFHIVIQITRAINKRRVKVMNSVKHSNKILYNFMKKNWQLFERSSHSIPDKEYKNKETRIIYSYDQLFYDCLKLDNDLNIAYEVLQKIIRLKKQPSNNVVDFFDKINKVLKNCNDIDIQKVGDTYKKWIVEICNAYSREALDNHLSNSIAENTNNHIKTIIKVSYGINNFQRLRKRALIISNTKR